MANTQKTVAYGDWKSPITVKSVTSKTKTLSSPRVCRRTGRSYYTETQDTGNNCIVEIRNDGVKALLPAEYSAGNTVYEYGGSAYDVLRDGRIIFSNRDNTVHILDPDTGTVSKLLEEIPTLRYSNFNANPNSPWVLAVQEDHGHDTPDQVKNFIVAINFITSEVKRVVSGADFYYTPQFSPDGTRLAWLEWDHPYLPFRSAKPFWADFDRETGSVSNSRLVAGDGEGEGGANEPHWGPDGSFFFGLEVGGHYRLYRVPLGETEPKQIKLDRLDDAEFGQISWLQGSQTYAPLSDKHVLAAAVTTGAARLILIDLDNNSWKQVADLTVISEVMFDAIACITEYSAFVIGSGTTSPQKLYKFTFGPSDSDITYQVIQESIPSEFDQSLFSIPEVVSVPSKGQPSQSIHGILWMPHNPNLQAPKGDLPPLIIQVHGGPTAHTGPGLKLRPQYFTTRGYAYFALNYTGSSGHGAAYRDALFGHWGIIDADDAAECAEYFISKGLVKTGAVGITGPSAGGYNTLQSLVRSSKRHTFAGGVCICGVSDVKKLGEDTHKLESKYLDPLLFGYPAPSDISEEERERVYKERSPIYHASDIEAPLLLLHGTKDTVVPIEQARIIKKAIEEKGGEVKMVEVEGEGHMFGAPESKRVWLEEEEGWWRRTLLGWGEV